MTNESNAGTGIVEATLENRGRKYGDYEAMSNVVQAIKKALRQSPNWQNLPPFMQESLEMAATKIGRILTGDPFEYDSWHDIEGYARLSADRCSGAQRPAVEPQTLDARWVIRPGSILYYQGSEVVVLERPHNEWVPVSYLTQPETYPATVVFWFPVAVSDLATPSNLPSEDDYKSARSLVERYNDQHQGQRLDEG